MAAQLLYWAEAMVIFPISETNVYVLAPGAPVPSAELSEAFGDDFPGVSLSSVLAEFSLPTSFSHKRPFGSSTVWLVEHQVINQNPWNHPVFLINLYFFVEPASSNRHLASSTSSANAAAHVRLFLPCVATSCSSEAFHTGNHASFVFPTSSYVGYDTEVQPF